MGDGNLCSWTRPGLAGPPQGTRFVCRKTFVALAGATGTGASFEVDLRCLPGSSAGVSELWTGDPKPVDARRAAVVGGRSGAGKQAYLSLEQSDMVPRMATQAWWRRILCRVDRTADNFLRFIDDDEETCDTLSEEQQASYVLKLQLTSGV